MLWFDEKIYLVYYYFLYTCGTEILAKTRIVIRLGLHSLPLSVFCAIPFKLNVLKGPFNKISTTTKGFLYKCIYALKKIRYIFVFGTFFWHRKDILLIFLNIIWIIFFQMIKYIFVIINEQISLTYTFKFWTTYVQKLLSLVFLESSQTYFVSANHVTRLLGI